MEKRIGLISLMTLMGLLGGCAEIRMPSPTGQYLIGTTDLIFTDSSREEKYGGVSGIKRSVLANIWYPAESTNGCMLRLEMTPNLIQALEKFMGFPSFMMGDPVKSPAAYNAPVNRSKKWPVIIFSHGFGSFASQNLTQMLELASRGYIVLSLNFNYETCLVEYPDGTNLERAETPAIINLNEIMKNPDLIGKKIAAHYTAIRNEKNPAEKIRLQQKMINESYYTAMKELLRERVLDSQLVLNSLEDLNTRTAVQGMADTKTVGVYGHSFGGALAAELALIDTGNVKAFIDVDAPVFTGTFTTNTIMKAPMLFMYSTDQKVGSSVIPSDRVNDGYFELSSAPVCSLTINGTGHYNFSDLGYIPFMKMNGMNGPIDGQVAGKIVISSILSWFDFYLKAVGKPLPEFIGEDLKVIKIERKGW